MANPFTNLGFNISDILKKNIPLVSDSTALNKLKAEGLNRINSGLGGNASPAALQKAQEVAQIALNGAKTNVQATPATTIGNGDATTTVKSGPESTVAGGPRTNLGDTPATTLNAVGEGANNLPLTHQGFISDAWNFATQLMGKQGTYKKPTYQESYIAPQQYFDTSNIQNQMLSQSRLNQPKTSDAQLNLAAQGQSQVNMNNAMGDLNDKVMQNNMQENQRVAEAWGAEKQNRNVYENQLIDIDNKAEQAKTEYQNMLLGQASKLAQDAVIRGGQNEEDLATNNALYDKYEQAIQKDMSNLVEKKVSGILGGVQDAEQEYETWRKSAGERMQSIISDNTKTDAQKQLEIQAIRDEMAEQQRVRDKKVADVQAAYQKAYDEEYGRMSNLAAEAHGFSSRANTLGQRGITGNTGWTPQNYYLYAANPEAYAQGDWWSDIMMPKKMQGGLIYKNGGSINEATKAEIEYAKLKLKKEELAQKHLIKEHELGLKKAKFAYEKIKDYRGELNKKNQKVTDRIWKIIDSIK